MTISSLSNKIWPSVPSANSSDSNASDLNLPLSSKPSQTSSAFTKTIKEKINEEDINNALDDCVLISNDTTPTCLSDSSNFPQADLASMETIKEEVVIDDSQSRYEYYYRGITNLFQIPVSGCLYPDNLKSLTWKKFFSNTQAKNKLSDGKPLPSRKWTPIIKDGAYSQQRKDGTCFVITTPTNDLRKDPTWQETKTSGGTFSIKEILEKIIQQLPKGKVEVGLPVAQCNNYLKGMRSRKHWVTLNVKIEDGQIYESILYDSRGWLNSVYGGKKWIEAQLNNIKGQKDAINVNAFYTGHQGFINNQDCGLFTIAYLELLYEGKEIPSATTEQVKSHMPLALQDESEKGEVTFPWNLYAAYQYFKKRANETIASCVNEII